MWRIKYRDSRTRSVGEEYESRYAKDSPHSCIHEEADKYCEPGGAGGVCYRMTSVAKGMHERRDCAGATL